MKEAIEVIEKEIQRVNSMLHDVYAALETARMYHRQKDQLEEKLLNLNTAKARLEMVIESEQPVNEIAQEDTWGDLELIK